MTQETDQLRRFLFKIVVVGDGGVGKSTMIQRLITGHFVPMKITIGTDLASYLMEFDDFAIKLQIWDFAGEKRFRFFLPNYSRGALGCILCFDLTRYSSFQNLPEWLEVIRGNADPVFLLVGGKGDLAEKRVVTLKEAIDFKEKYDLIDYIETSSKTGENNFNVFETLTKAIIKKRNLA